MVFCIKLSAAFLPHTEGIMADPRTFGRYLYFLRKSRKLTLRSLAEKINVSPYYLSLIENDKKATHVPRYWAGCTLL